MNMMPPGPNKRGANSPTTSTTSTGQLKPPSSSKFSFTSPLKFKSNSNRRTISPSKSGIPTPSASPSIAKNSTLPSSKSFRSTIPSTRLPTASMRSLRPRDNKGRVSISNQNREEGGPDEQDEPEQGELQSAGKGKGRERERSDAMRPRSSLGKRRLPSQEEVDIESEIESEIESGWNSEEEGEGQEENEGQASMDEFGRVIHSVNKHLDIDIGNGNGGEVTPTRARGKLGRLIPGPSTSRSSPIIKSPQSKVARQGSVMTDVHANSNSQLPRSRSRNQSMNQLKSGIPTASGIPSASSSTTSNRASPRHLAKSRANTLGWNGNGGSKPRSRMSIGGGGGIPRSKLSSGHNPSHQRNRSTSVTSNASIKSVNLDGDQKEGRRSQSRNSDASSTFTSATAASENLMAGLGGHSRRVSLSSPIAGGATDPRNEGNLEKENKLPVPGIKPPRSNATANGPPSAFDSQLSTKNKNRSSLPVAGPPNSFKAPSSSKPSITPSSKAPQSGSSSGGESVKSRAKAWEAPKSSTSIASKGSKIGIKFPKASSIQSTTPTKDNRSDQSPTRTPSSVNSISKRSVTSSNASRMNQLSKLPSSRSLAQLHEQQSKQSVPSLATPEARDRGLRRLSSMGFNSNGSSGPGSSGSGVSGKPPAGPVSALKTGKSHGSSPLRGSSSVSQSKAVSKDQSSIGNISTTPVSTPPPTIQINSDQDSEEAGPSKSSQRVTSEQMTGNLEDGLIEMLIKAGIDPSASEDFIHRQVEKKRSSLSPAPSPNTTSEEMKTSESSDRSGRRNSQSVEDLVDKSWSTETSEPSDKNQSQPLESKSKEVTSTRKSTSASSPLQNPDDTVELNSLSLLSENGFGSLLSPLTSFKDLPDGEHENLMDSPSVGASNRSSKLAPKAATSSRGSRQRREENFSATSDQSLDFDVSGLGLETGNGLLTDGGQGDDSDVMGMGALSSVGSGLLMDDELMDEMNDFMKNRRLDKSVAYHHSNSIEDSPLGGDRLRLGPSRLKQVDSVLDEEEGDGEETRGPSEREKEKDARIKLLESKLKASEETLNSVTQTQSLESSTFSAKLEEAQSQIEQFKERAEFDEQARHEISKAQETSVEELEKLKIESYEKLKQVRKEKEREIRGFREESCLIKWKEEGRIWKEVERLARSERLMMKNESDMLIFLKRQSQDWERMLKEVVANQ